MLNNSYISAYNAKYKEKEKNNKISSEDTSKYNYVYETIDTVNNKRYIGVRGCNCPIEEDNYIGSGTDLKKAIKKHGKKSFQKNILAICSTKRDAYMIENMYIKDRKAVQSEDYYNKTSDRGYTSMDLDKSTFISLYPKNSSYSKLVEEINEYKKTISKLNDKIIDMNNKLDSIYNFKDSLSNKYKDFEYKINELESNHAKEISELNRSYIKRKKELEADLDCKIKNLNNSAKLEYERLGYEKNRVDNYMDVIKALSDEISILKDKNHELLCELYKNKED